MKRVLQRWLAQYFSTEEAVLLSIFLVVSVVVVATLGRCVRASNCRDDIHLFTSGCG